jgi:hypothetical protein
MLVDLELCKSAIFTQPADQAVWFYSQWLCAKSPSAQETLVHTVQELQTIEPDQHPMALLFLSKHASPKDTAALLETLSRIDPMRAGFYGNLRIQSQVDNNL